MSIRAGLTTMEEPNQEKVLHFMRHGKAHAHSLIDCLPRAYKPKFCAWLFRAR